MKNEKLLLALEAIEILEKGMALSKEIDRKRANNEEVSLSEIKEMLLLTIKRDEMLSQLGLEKDDENEEAEKVRSN